MKIPIPMTFCKRCAAVLLTVVLLPCCGCYKGDGTETPPAQQFGVPEPDPNAAYKESITTNVTIDSNAKTDYPFAFDASTVAEPTQDILLVMIYDNYEDGRTQTVNFYDKNGNVYRYRQPLDTAAANWFATLRDYYLIDATASPVNIMGDAERQTLWYMASQQSTYAAADIATQSAGSDPMGVRSLYLINENGESMLLVRYDDTVMYRQNAEVTAFANWFRFFFHGTYQFPVV